MLTSFKLGDVPKVQHPIFLYWMPEPIEAVWGLESWMKLIYWTITVEFPAWVFLHRSVTTLHPYCDWDDAMSNVVAVAGVLRKSCPGSECLQRKWPQVQRIDVRSILVPREHAESMNEHGIVGPLCHPFLFFSFAVHSWMLSQWIMMECLPTCKWFMTLSSMVAAERCSFNPGSFATQCSSTFGSRSSLHWAQDCICCQTAGGQGMLATEIWPRSSSLCCLFRKCPSQILRFSVFGASKSSHIVRQASVLTWLVDKVLKGRNG